MFPAKASAGVPIIVSVEVSVATMKSRAPTRAQCGRPENSPARYAGLGGTRSEQSHTDQVGGNDGEVRDVRRMARAGDHMSAPLLRQALPIHLSLAHDMSGWIST